MESGDDDGYVVKSICDVSDTNGIAALCLDGLEGYVFKPFVAGGAYLDPIVEIGDSVAIAGKIYQVMSLDWNVQKIPTARVYAPYDQEIDHEYKATSPEAKNYRKTMSAVDNKLEDYLPWDEVSTAIEQNAESVVIAASGTYVTQTTFNNEIAEIQAQIDGNIQSWSGNAVPTLNNAPAVDWTTPAAKATHVGDMYFVNSDAGIPEAGNYYRFEENNGTYSWQLVTDSAITEALAKAAAALAAAEDAQDTADAASAEAQLKGRIFVVQPTPPYSVGDLWFNSAQSEILTCMTARESGNYVASDWVKRNKYTDDSAFNAFQETYSQTIAAIQDQVDKKAETYYQATDPVSSWVDVAIAGIAIAGLNVVGIESSVAQAHKGDLWYRTTDNTTWYWDGEKWVQQDVPDEVFDKIDGKAQIFIVQPYTPYNVGDLWFDSANSDIMTCITARASGSFVQGDWQKRNKYTDDSALTSFVNATYNPTIAAIQADLDGKIDTYFYNYEPTLSNVPASQWSTTALKEEHLDDLFYNTTTGYTYRFTKSGSTYSWVRVKDSDITSAMQAASSAQDTADGKRRVFVSQPTDDQEYDVGDLWVNATYGSTYTNDILKCKTAKASGTEFSISHWEKASKYTDDSSFNAFVNSVYTPEISAIQSELDGKVDTYFYAYAPTLSNIPASQWNTDELREEHVDDLFFDTVSGYTYRFKKDGSTYSWERVKDSDITAAMTAASTAQDTADGKRRVFVSQPTNAQAYDVGDLWVNATYGSTYSNDLLRCKTAKAAGTAFNISHWEKASKYTDDSAANAVAEELTQFESSFSVEPSQINAEITKRVIKDHSETKTTFGWEMTDTYHKWYADNSEVVRINSNGVYVKGEIRATTGYIGNDSYGFEINATNFHNGLTSLSDTTHNGVYVGTDGIALGQGKFKVTSSGAVTASNLAITGGSIKLGGTDQSPVFNVTSSGAVTASNITINGGSITIRDGNNNVIFSANSSGVTVNGNGTFTGTVYAGNIVSAATQAGAGYFNGAGITAGSIYGGGASGQIAQNTLGDYNVAKSGGAGAYTTASFSSGVQGSLYNADRFGYATQRGSASYPEYFCATSITALSSMYANEFYIELGNDRQLALKTHYHTVTVSQDGTVQFGQPTDTRPDPFNIADTHFFEDYVSAIDVSSITITYPDGESSYPYYDSATLGKIIEFKVQYQISDGSGTVLTDGAEIKTVPATAAYDAGYDAGEDSVSVTAIQYYTTPGEETVTYNDTNQTLSASVQATLTNGNTGGSIRTVTIPATLAYNAGYTAGSGAGSDSVYVTAMQYYTIPGEQTITYNATNNTLSASVQATLSNGNTTGSIRTVTFPADLAYTAGYDDGENAVSVTAIAYYRISGEDTVTYDSTTKTLNASVQATLTNGNTNGSIRTVTIPATLAYNAGYTDGSGSGADSVYVTAMQYYTVSGEQTISYDPANKTLSASVQATLTNGNTNGSIRTVTFPANLAYNAGASDGVNAGASTAYVSNITTGNAGFPSYSSEDQVYYANVSITATARGTKSDGTYYTDDRTITRAVNVSTVYTTARTLGVNEGAQSAYVSAIDAGAAGTPSYSSEDQVYYATVPITATARGTKADGSFYTADRTINRAVDVTAVYNAGKAAGGININDVVVTRLYSPDRGWVTSQDSSGYHVGVLASVTANGQTKDENAVVSVDDIVNFFSLNNGSVISTNSRNYDEFDYSGYIQNALYTYNGYNYGRIKLTNSAGDMEYIVRVQFDTSGSGAGQITIVNAETSASVNPYYNATATTPRLPYYAYIGGKHYVYISATSTGVSNRTQYIDINDIVNVAYQQGGGGGGGSYSYYWSDEKSGPYGSKQRDCYFTVNGSIVQTAKVIWSSGNPSFQ